MHDTGNQKILS